MKGFLFHVVIAFWLMPQLPAKPFFEKLPSLPTKARFEALRQLYLDQKLKFLHKDKRNKFLESMQKSFRKDQYEPGEFLAAGIRLHLTNLRTPEAQKRVRQELDRMKDKMLKMSPFLASLYHFVEGRWYYYSLQEERSIKSFLLAHSLAEGQEVIFIAEFISRAYYWTSEYQNAIRYAQEALEIADQFDNEMIKIRMKELLGDIYRALGEYGPSNDYLFDALNIARTTGFVDAQVSILATIAGNKNSTTNNKEALNYLKEAERIIDAERLKEDTNMDPYLSLTIYQTMSQTFSVLNLFNEAELYAQKAIKQAEESQIVSEIIESKLSLSFLFIEQLRYPAAIKLLKSLSGSNKKDWSSTALALHPWYLARAYLAVGDLARARTMIEEAILLAKENLVEFDQQQVFELAVKIYKKLNESSKAMEFQKKSYELKLKLAEEMLEKNVYAKENDLLKADSKIKDLKIRESEWVRTGAIILTGFAIILVLISYRLYRMNRENNKLQSYIQKQILTRFLPPELVSDVMQGKFKIDAKPQKKIITVLFADIVGFTNMIDQIEVEVAEKLLNRFLQEITETIYRFNGTIDKFIGDAVMVIFGAPVACSAISQAQRSVDCGKAMLKTVDRLNQEFLRDYNLKVEIRIGINQGEALVGIVGNEKRSDYTAIGHTVNVASRVEGQAHPQQILFTEYVADLIQDSHESVGKRKLKGIDEEVELFKLSLQDTKGRTPSVA